MKLNSVALLLFFILLSPLTGVNARNSMEIKSDSIFGNESFRTRLLGLEPFSYDRMITPFVDDPFNPVNAGEFRFGLNPYRHMLCPVTSFSGLDTNSGVSNINLILGSKREQLLFIDHHQKVSRHMKARVAYNSIVSPGFLLNSFATYRRIFTGLDYSKKRVRSSFEFQYNRLSVDENGGVSPAQETVGLSLSEFEQLRTYLPDDRRLVRDWQLNSVNEFLLSKPADSIFSASSPGLFFLLNADWKRFGSSYEGVVDTSFFPNVYKDSTTTADSIGFLLWRLSPGLSFRIGKGAVRMRFDAGFSFTKVSSIQNDSGASGNYSTPFAAFSFSLRNLDMAFRYETVAGPWFNDGDYSWSAMFTYFRPTGFIRKWSGSFQQRRIAPGLLTADYAANQIHWSNEFDKENYLLASGRFEFLNGRVAAYIDAARVDDWVYMNEAAIPVQADNAVALLKSGLEWKGEWRKWQFSVMMVHAARKGDQVRFPDWSAWSRISYKAAFFKKALKAEVGVAVYGTQAYDAMGFMPLTGERYLINGFRTGGVPVLDAFFHAGIGRATLSFVVQRVNDGLFGDEYYVAPGYPAPPRTLKFVMRWLLFN